MSEEPLRNVVKSIIGKLEEKEGGRKEGTVIDLWERVVKKDISKHSKPVSLKRGRLVVNVSDSSRLYQLTLKKQEIIKALNKIFKKKKIREIRFRIGEV